MNFQDLIQRAQQIRQKYGEFEKQGYGREWTSEELMLGLMKDIGDLAKIVQAKEGVRDGDASDEALGHELSDILWSIIVLADKYDIDLESAFTKTMNQLDERLSV